MWGILENKTLEKTTKEYRASNIKKFLIHVTFKMKKTEP